MDTKRETVEENPRSQISQQEPARNTNKGWQLYRWFMTIPADEYTASQLSQLLSSCAKKWTFQKEKGTTETAYEHWQVALSLKTKEYFHTVKNLFGNKTHVEPLRSNAGFNYCEKSETRIEGPYTETKKPIKLIITLREWQQELINLILKEPDDRSIHWYVDIKGGEGKTSMAKYLIHNHQAAYFTNAKTRDLAYALKEDTKIVIFDLTRSLEGHTNYAAIETIKNGLVFSSKYESSLKIMDVPHVLVFANWEPDYKAMSEDRWIIHWLNEKPKKTDLMIETD